jgi:ribosome-associated protein
MAAVRRTTVEERDFISKTRRKRQMKELQDMGAALVKLSDEQLARLEMPERLREAVRECKRFTKHEAVRRQMQYIGRIMREYDTGPIVSQLSAIEAPTRRQAALFHAAERWRQEMLADPAAIDGFLREYPEADAHALRGLVAAAREEREAERAPRQFRELFHWLNALIQDHARRHP